MRAPVSCSGLIVDIHPGPVLLSSWTNTGTTGGATTQVDRGC